MSAPAIETPQLALRAAMQARDLDAALATFAPEAVLRSPFTSRLAFHGPAQIAGPLEIVIEKFENLNYTDELVVGDRAVLVATATVAGKEIEVVDHMHLDEHGLIDEMTIFFRPLPAVAVALRVIGTGLAARRGPARAALTLLGTRPLGAITEFADRAGVALLRNTV